MKPLGFAKSQAYWYRFAWGTFMGFLGGLFAFIYIIPVEKGIQLLWHSEAEKIAPFSGSFRTVTIMTIAGLLVGLVYKLRPTEEVDVFGAIPEGTMDLRCVFGAVLASIVSLIGGFSLGPEAPTGILAGGFGVWLSNKQGLPKEIRRTNFLSAVAGAFSGLFTAPYAVVAMLLELRHKQSGFYYGTLAIGAVASMLGFAIFYALYGNRFSPTLRLLDLPPYELRVWHLILGIGLGVLAVPFALLFAILMKRFHHLMAPLRDKHFLRCGGMGLLLGLLAMAMPTTLLLGSEGLFKVIEEQAELGIGFLIAAALLKIVATTAALGAGFIGGPIFPLFFTGGTIGLVLSKIIPAIPLELSVGCLMAAVPGAIVPFPLTLALIVLLITSTPVTEAIPIMTATLTAHLLLKGFILGGEPGPMGQRLRDIDAELQEQADPEYGLKPETAQQTH
ncbi:MAG: chloride channel protein [Microcoleaceae cyanobacterium]